VRRARRLRCGSCSSIYRRDENFCVLRETESAHIQHYVALAALAFPEVAFTLIKDTARRVAIAGSEV